MELLRIWHQLWAHLVSPKSTKDLKAFALISILFFVATLIKPFEETSDKVKQSYLTLSQRLGYAILLEAGYFKAEPVVVQQESNDNNEKTPEVQETGAWRFEEVGDHPDLQCLTNSAPIVTSRGEALDVRGLTLAILAAEKYNRNAIRRGLEIQIAKLSLILRGTLPNFSYGLAQIQASKAREILAAEFGNETIQDPTLFELLTNDCQNIQIAAKYIQQLAEKYHAINSVEDMIREIALEYNGATPETINGLTYVDAILGAYNIVYSKPYNLELMDRFHPIYVGCSSFSPDSSTSIKNIEWSRYQETQETSTDEKPAKVYVFFPPHNPSLKGYSILLLERREKELLDSFSYSGFSKENIFFLERNQYSLDYIQNQCSGREILIMMGGT